MLKSTSIDIAKFRFRIARATVNECERNAELTAKSNAFMLHFGRIYVKQVL